jgi:hypothetical protein
MSHKKMPGQTFADLFNWFEGIQAWSDAPLKSGSIVAVVGMHGTYQTIAPATRTSQGRLYVVKHESPGKQVSVILPWFVKKGVEGAKLDTTPYKQGAPVYLHDDGSWHPAPPAIGLKMQVGHVLEVHPDWGAVRLDPHGYGPAVAQAEQVKPSAQNQPENLPRRK